MRGTCFAIDERAELGGVLTLFLWRIMLMFIERKRVSGRGDFIIDIGQRDLVHGEAP